MTKSHKKMSRSGHSKTNGFYIKTKAECVKSFNCHHQRLKGIPPNKDTALVTIEESQGPVTQIKRAIAHYPRAWKALKWTAFSVGLTSLIFFTGGLGAIPLIGSISAQLGLWTIPILSTLVEIISPIAWYFLVKPPLKKLLNCIFYPEFQIYSDDSFNKNPMGPILESSPQSTVKDAKLEVEPPTHFSSPLKNSSNRPRKESTPLDGYLYTMDPI